MRYCEKRKEILLQIDRGDKVDNSRLGMYDLTPYFKESYEDSLVEKIMYVKNENRRVKHLDDIDIYFSPPQEEALNFLKENERCILSAPTSFGKTMILKEYIYRLSPKKIVYIVPTNSLAYELEYSFKQNKVFSYYDIFDREITNKNLYLKNRDSDYCMFIGTQEKYLEIKDSTFDSIDLFVIDEAYKLADTTKKQRGYKLSEVFIKSNLKKSKKIVLLSPNAIFTGFTDFKIYESYFNAVDKVFYQITREDFYTKLQEKAELGKTIVFLIHQN